MGEIQETGAPVWSASSRVRRIKLHVISSAEHWPVLEKESPGDVSPFMSGKGDGGVDLLCGNCEHVLADHIYPADKLAGMVLRCPACAALNLA